jgi:hypothetical protein
MSYYKFTSVSGRKADGSFHGVTVNGHWNIHSAIKRARMSKIVGKIVVEHCVSDRSGKGRGGHDGRWVVDEKDEHTKVAKWSEFGKEHV